MNKAIETLTREAEALTEAAAQLTRLIADHENTDLAYYCDLGLQQCEQHIAEVHKGLKLLQDNAKK